VLLLRGCKAAFHPTLTNSKLAASIEHFQKVQAGK